MLGIYRIITQRLRATAFNFLLLLDIYPTELKNLNMDVPLFIIDSNMRVTKIYMEEPVLLIPK